MGQRPGLWCNGPVLSTGAIGVTARFYWYNRPVKWWSDTVYETTAGGAAPFLPSARACRRWPPPPCSSWSYKKVGVHVEALRETLGNLFAHRSRAGQDLRDPALRRHVVEIALLQAILLDQEAQDFARPGVGDLDVLILVDF